jgi:membrane-associated phospholipid phosphatase
MKIRKNSWFFRNIDEIIEDFSSFGDPSILFIIWLLIFRLDINYLLIFIVGMFFIEVIGGTIKVIWYKERPNKMAHETILDKVYTGSFPSIHVARAVFVFSFISTQFSGILLFMFPLIIATVAFSRMYLRKHFSIDVFGGFVLGTAAVFLILFLK